jgi:hypothetical protein
MSKYFVTYAVVDTEAGFNIFGHSFLLMSEQAEEGGPIRVLDAIGFYSQPSTTTRPSHKRIKRILGLTVDLQDGHGVLKKEAMRYLDGNGVHGCSFEVSMVKFQQLRDLYQTQMDNEQKAIRELNEQLIAAELDRLKALYAPSGLTEQVLMGLSERSKLAANGFTRFQAEKGKPNPRLQPFHVAMEVTARGWFDSRNSHNCKHMALELLIAAKIIDKEKAKSIIGNKAGAGFPRTSQLVEPLRLISTGEPITDVSKKQKKRHYNRTWENGNQLFWATKPVLDQASKQELSANITEYEQLKSMLNKVREIEITLREALHDSPNTPNLKLQLDRVQSIYNLLKKTDQSSLIQKLVQAESILNVAHLSLAPHQANYPLILRVYESFSLRGAMLCLLGALAASLFLSNPIGIACLAVSATAGLAMFGMFIKEDIVDYSKMNSDYQAFKNAPAAAIPAP